MTRFCGCKGIRTCLLCEEKLKVPRYGINISKDMDSYVFCPSCSMAYPGWDKDLYQEHPNHKGDPIKFPGVYLHLDFITATEESDLISGCDKIPWDLSQSGRRKQNFGPKCNFKRRKLKIGDFRGFPSYTRFVQERFKSVELMKGYRTIEQCAMEYTPERGASINPHIDDCWVWGERVAQINLLSDTVLTLTKYRGGINKYNLDDTEDYYRIVTDEGRLCGAKERIRAQPQIFEKDYKELVVRVPLPARSLLVLYGPARYAWEHSILREDIHSRRLVIAYREFTPPYLPGNENYDESKQILAVAEKFWEK